MGGFLFLDAIEISEGDAGASDFGEILALASEVVGLLQRDEAMFPADPVRLC